MSLRKTSKADLEGYKIIAAVVLLFVLMFSLRGWMSAQEKPGPDDCMSVVTKNTVIILDHSQGVAQQTIDEVINRALMHVDLNVEPHTERISIFAVDSKSKQALVPLFSRCKPLAKKDVNPIFTGTRGLDKKFAINFKEPLAAHLKLKADSGSDSPIAQTLTDLSLTRFMSAQHTNLLVFSDMLEHTSNFSMYQCIDGERAIAQYRESRRGAQERPTFKNTAVSLNVIPRRPLAPNLTRCRDRFWLWFFGDSSGDSSLETIYLPG